MIQAWAFYRRSTNLQEVSIDDQRRECQDFCAQKGWGIVREFIPKKGFASGLTIDKDPQFREMVLAAETTGHGAKFLVVYDVSRFGRLKPEEKIYWEQRFKKQGNLQVIYVRDDFKNDGSIGDAVTKLVKHSEAHEYSIKLSRDTLRGCLTHASLGHSCGGSASYGYDRLLVDQQGKAVKVLNRGERKADKLQRIVWTPGSEEKVATLRWIFESFLKGLGLWKIADELNKKRVPSPYGGTWSKSCIRSILKNPVYTGLRLYNQRDWRDRDSSKCKIKPPEEWVRMENAHTALISKDLFDGVQGMFKIRRPGAGRRYNCSYLLSGMGTCGHCGHNFQGHQKQHAGIKKLYYVCGGYVMKGTEVCAGFSIPADYFENFALAEIQERITSPSRLNDIESRLAEMLNGMGAPDANAERAMKAQELGGVESQIQNILKVVRSGRNYPSLLAELDTLEAQRKRLTEDQKESRAEQRPPLQVDAKAILSEVRDHLDNFPKIMARGTMEEKRLLMRTFIQKVDVAPQERKAYFNFFHIPALQNKIADWRLPAGDLSFKLVAGAGFEPATSRL